MTTARPPGGAKHLDLADLQRPVRRPFGPRGKAMAFAATALAVGAAGVVGVVSWQGGKLALPDWTTTVNLTSPQAAAPGLPRLPAPDLLVPLTPEEAKAVNEERPIVAPGQPPVPFAWRGERGTRLRAVDCLAQAIYYEAASEGVDGGRAVAQVVLNRVRHPGYPNSVCGTVYQGSERTTGCQFSFTCDGSLARAPIAYLWIRSRQIAEEALAGRVFAPVGLATHYHADYVLPYWADSLDKAAVLGRHIFYRFRGSNGSRAAFSQRYAATEPQPPLPSPSAEVIEEGLNAVAAMPGESEAAPIALPKVEEDRVESLTAPPKATSQINQPLAADLDRGNLILGEPAPAPSARKRAAASECGATGESKVKAMGANDLRVTQGKTVC